MSTTRSQLNLALARADKDALSACLDFAAIENNWELCAGDEDVTDEEAEALHAGLYEARANLHAAVLAQIDALNALEDHDADALSTN